MFKLIEKYQLDIMLIFCSICASIMILLLFTRFLPKKRKWTLVLMEFIATLLLAFDRAAYIYKGDLSKIGSVMVRVSNFMVFFLTSAVILGFNLYLTDLIMTKSDLKQVPLKLKIVNVGACIGMVLVIVSQFTGLYYWIDEENIYHRGSGFLICYMIPVVFPFMQYMTVRQYKSIFSKMIYTSLVLYIFIPIFVGILQIFTYGISIVNMAIVLVSVSLYIFTYLDINNEVVRAHEIEVGTLQKEQASMKRLFNQTVTAFVTAVEKRVPNSEGHSLRVAECARKIAKAAGKSEEKCDEVYYAALLHDVGMIAIPDSVIKKKEGFTEEELQQRRQKPVLSGEILSSITEYPYLGEGTRYSHEKYDGTGYPEGLKGEDIPEISRIIAVASAYDSMMNKNKSNVSYQVIREELIKQSGSRFDPIFAEIMVRLMDESRSKQKKKTALLIEKELDCAGYRETVSVGIPMTPEQSKISFLCEAAEVPENGFSAPSIVIFSSYDRRIHNEVRTIEAYNYLEYGEVWFDGHYVSTNARKTKVNITKKSDDSSSAGEYKMLVGRYEDHLKIFMENNLYSIDVAMAISDVSREVYVGLTGENCHLREIAVKKTGYILDSDKVSRIVSKITYIDRLESDLPNVQIDHSRSAYTEAFPVEDEIILDFHTMSLPSANLVWHCPYILLFYSDDKKVGGQGYREYALIKINGEVTGNNDFSENIVVTKKEAAFPGWDIWKIKNREGMECSVRFLKKGNKVIVYTENLGVVTENTTILNEKGKVYAAITGSRVAITDIRLR